MEMQQSVEGFRLSPQQARLWRWLAAPAAGLPHAAYIAQCRVEIAGELDRPALGRALERAGERNELLRTAFRLLPGLAAPLQVISAPVPLPLAGRDLSGRDPAEQEAELAARLAADREAPFDLAAVPLLRASLWTLAPQRHALLLTLPALLADAAGLDNLVREVALCYAEALGAAPVEEPVQYVDLSEWQHELLDSEETREGREFWQRQVTAWPAPLEPILPWREAGEPLAGPFSPRAVPVALAADLGGRIETLARAAGVEVQAALLAGWLAVLRRATGEDRLAIAVAYDGRKFEELKEALGPFARHLPVAVQVAEGERFRDLPALLREALREPFEWQEYFSWERFAEPVGTCLDSLPLAFEYRRRPRAHRAGAALFTAVWCAACGERFEVGLLCRERACDGRLEAEVRYDASRVPERAAVLLAERFATLLASAVAAPDQAIGELELLGPEERRSLAAANDTGIDFGRPQLLHALVEEQAARSPQRIAVVAGGVRLTYAALDARADRLAHRLRVLRVGPETRVAVCLERSPEMVVALLAVLKAGGAYVPLDPSYPAARLALMMEDARPAVLVVAERPPAGVPLPDLRVVDVASEQEPGRALEEDDAGDPAAAISPDQLAYVLYTSGSTGRPKGVLVSHRAICNRLLWMQRAFPLGITDRVLQKTPYSFDASIWEIFSPLLAGAQLVLARPQGHQDMAYLAGAVASQGITTLQLVPSLLRPFLDEPGVAACGDLRRLFCGGEELPAALVERVRSLLPCTVTNLYGPTEAAIDATFHEVQDRGSVRPAERLAAPPGAHTKERSGVGRSHDPGAGRRVPIGRPLANVQVHLVNSLLAPVPTGAAGELLIGGAGLARGYLGRPDLTAERFLPDLFASVPGGRLYRTGDLAWRRPDGEIEYLGRIDRQVKVRGVRIELGEIEALLAAHPGVRQAVVAARAAATDGREDARLVAYVVPRPGGEPPRAGALREVLAEKLPVHMMPAAFVRLRSLPLTPSGKLDLRALPEPEPAAGAAGEETAPRTPTEQLLAGLWAEVLGCSRVTAEDSFFELGGHSLNATQVVSRARKAFGVELRIQTLFEAPVLSAFAAAVDRAVRAGHGLAAPPIEPLPRGGRLPLSFAQQRLWFLEQRLPGTPLYNIPDAFRFAGELNVAALAAALGETVRRHESLRTTFPALRGEAIQWIAPPNPRTSRRPLPLVDLTALPAAVREPEAARWVAAEGERPFDLARGPLLRALLLRLDAAEHWLPLTLHHIVSDAWSAGVLVREVAALYRACVAGEASPLPEPRLQYADFAAWQRRWLAGDVLAGHLDYWRRQLAGAPPVLDLPTDRPRPPGPYHRGATRPVRLSPELAAALKALARRESATLFMVLLAVFQVLLRHLSRRDDVVVGTDIANRNHADTERMIGFFINQLVLRTRLGGDPGFTELLARVREATLGAYAHQDMPFDLLVDDLLPERPHHAPLFQVKFFLENTPAERIELPGLSLSRLPVDMRTAKLDLTLALQETPEGLAGWINYSTDLFEARTITRLMRQFTRLAEAVAARPEARLHELDEVLAEQARQERAAEKKDLLALGFKRIAPVQAQEAAGAAGRWIRRET
jgi:amino acid adenylation domain-containing protein